ncbi:hypothetical protein GOODEAATRI_029936 [Goodea atripinnis]|uniref:Uncharacterized protein n=1 Tax=Goodea atripinnis TaxID=208336 RepID=A0ABV0N5D1_9TELE
MSVVCSRRPISSSQPRLTSRPVLTPEDVCFIRQSLEGNIKVYTLYQTKILTKFHNCNFTNFTFKINVTAPVSNYVELLAGSRFPHCVGGRASVPEAALSSCLCM